jgi:hypothetical protein
MAPAELPGAIGSLAEGGLEIGRDLAAVAPGGARGAYTYPHIATSSPFRSFGA